MSLLAEMRRAIKTSDKTRYRMYKETGISQSILCRFLKGGKVGMRMENLERLAECLGFEIVLRPKRKGRQT